jgi:hypothetical protein
MKKKKKLIRNLIILFLLVIIAASFSTASITSLAAHKRSERTANYGPSIIIKSQSIKGGRVYLCKYDKWFSLNTVKRSSIGLWYAGDQVHGMENDTKVPIVYSWGVSTMGQYRQARFFGIVNNPDIKSVKLDLKLNGELKTLEQKELYDSMFLFIWEEGETGFQAVKITGLDKNSGVIYEKVLP